MQNNYYNIIYAILPMTVSNPFLEMEDRHKEKWKLNL